MVVAKGFNPMATLENRTLETLRLSKIAAIYAALIIVSVFSGERPASSNEWLADC